MPTDAYALTCLPHRRYVFANGVDQARDLVSRHTRIHDPRPMSFLGQRIAVAQAASLHFHPHFALSRFTHLAFHQLKCTARTHHLHRTHLLRSHKFSESGFASLMPTAPS